MQKPKKKRRNYINNRSMYEALQVYHQQYKHSEETGTAKPEIPKYLAQCVWQIANRLSTKPNFSGYSYRDEMVGDGVENCLLYLHKFNPEKYDNPFAYYTQIIKFAFLRRIEREKKQQYVKMKMRMFALTSENEFAGQQVEEHNEIAAAFIEDYENKLSAKAKAAKEKQQGKIGDTSK